MTEAAYPDSVIVSSELEPLQVGALIDGRYRIEAVLGAGAMGCVYRAEHTGIGRTVAIKVLRAELGGSQEATKRFKREALASGRLDHPNIVGVSDFGVLDDGSCFLVMEALQGESLGDRIEREGPVPWQEAAEIMRGILRGLKHAHDRGVVHRDIKPHNIFLARQDDRRVVKLLDFGIAKLVAGAAEDPAATRAGMTMGTPSYLSPEQAVGGEITPASDLYSATVVLFEMLTGSPPFQDTDLVAVMMAHVTKDPPRLVEIAPTLQVPPRLDAVVRRGLAKLVADRIASAADYLELLDAIEMAADTDSSPPGPMFAAEAPTPWMSGAVHAVTLSQSLPAAAMRPLSIGDGDAIPRKWLWTAAAVCGAVLLVVIAATGTDGHDQDLRGAGHPRAEPAGPPAASPADPVDVAERAPVVAAKPSPPAIDRETMLKALLHDLKTGRTCAERRNVIPKLVELGDARAVPSLKAARYRMRGGVLGVGASNTNACLKKDAQAAIKALGTTAASPE